MGEGVTPPDVERPGIERVLSQVGGVRVVEKLSRLSGPDLTTLLLDVASRRASGISAADVLARSRTDRFSRPNVVPWRELRRGGDAFIAPVLPSDWPGSNGSSEPSSTARRKRSPTSRSSGS